MKFKKLSTLNWSLISIFIIPLLFILILRFFGFDGLYGQDSYEYLRYTKAIKEYFIHRTHPGNYYWPVLYPFLGGLLSFITGSEIIALQLITGVSLSIGLVYLLKIIQLLYPYHKSTVQYVILFGMLSPLFFKISLVIMSDITTAMFIILCFYFFVKTYQDSNTSVYPVFFFATCAFMTRYPSLLITFPVIIYSFLLIVKRKAIKDFFIAILTSFLVCIPFLVFQSNKLYGAGSNYFLNAWSISNYFKSSYTTVDGLQSYRFANIIHTLSIFFHPRFIFIGIGLLFLMIQRYREIINSTPLKLISISIIIYILFLAGIPFQNPRILGLIFPLVLLLFYPFFYQLIKFKIIKKNLLALGLITVIIQISLWLFTFRHIYQRSRFEKEMVQFIIPYQGNTLHSFDIDIALKGRGLEFNFENMYLGETSIFQENDLVLFHPNRFNKQWSTKNLMKNWNYLNEKFQLKVIKKGPDGWNLYQITKL